MADETRFSDSAKFLVPSVIAVVGVLASIFIAAAGVLVSSGVTDERLRTVNDRQSRTVDEFRSDIDKLQIENGQQIAEIARLQERARVAGLLIDEMRLHIRELERQP